MTTTAKKNAIEKRLDAMSEVWDEFAHNADGRLLRWVIDPNASRLMDLFLDLQCEGGGDAPHLFVRFREPFEQAREYGYALRQSLLDQYADIREGIAAEGVAADWQCPEPVPGESDIRSLLRACASMQRYYKDIMVHLVAVVTPAMIPDPPAWADWLGRLLQSDVPPHVRFLVVEDRSARRLDQLCDAEPKRVVSVEPELDLPGAYEELARDIPRSGAGCTFRRLFVALANAAAVGNTVAAQQAADRAAAIANEQGWPQLLTAVQMALGAAYLAAGDRAKTLECYRAANKAIAGQDAPAAAQLDIQTRFAEAAVLIGDGRHADAAAVYEQIAPIAEKQADAFALLESRRMAAYCREATGQYDAAWHQGQQAIEAGAKLDEATRPDSTLPFVGQGLLRLIDDGRIQEDPDQVRRRMVELVGEDWERRLPS